MHSSVLATINAADIFEITEVMGIYKAKKLYMFSM